MISLILILILISGILLIYYFSSLGHEYSPSGKIFSLLEGKNMTFEEIVGHFPSDLISDRLTNLKKVGMVRYKEEKFSLTQKGKTIALFFVLYRKVLGWR